MTPRCQFPRLSPHLGIFSGDICHLGSEMPLLRFACLVSKLLLGLDTFCAAYLDDIIIFSDTWEEHLSNLRTVLSRIRATNLTLSPRKCCLAVAEVEYLGHHVGLGRVQPWAKKVQAVQDFPAPTNRRQLQKLLGLFGWVLP